MINNYKISAEEFAKTSFSRLATRPNSRTAYGEGQMSAEELKRRLDKQGEMFRAKFNAFLSLVGHVGEGDSLAGFVYTGIAEDHTLKALFEDIVSESGRFASYLSVGDMTLMEKLKEIAAPEEEVKRQLEEHEAEIEERLSKASQEADEKYVQKVVKKNGISVYTTSEQEPTLAIAQGTTVGSIARRYNGGRLRAGDPVEELDAVNLGFAAKTYVGKTGNQTIDGGLTVKGDFIVEGDNYRTEVEVLNVKDAVIVANSDGVPLAGLSGYVLRTANGDYGILYDPAEDCVKIGLGGYDGETKTFTFNEGEAQPLATRGVITDGNIPVWDAIKRTFVDGGLSIERLKDEIEAAIEACVKDMEPKEEAVPSSVPKRGENAELAVGDPVEALDAVNLRTMNRKTANALIGEKSGGAVVLDDVAPVPNTVKVTLESMNLVPVEYTDAKRGSSITRAGITFTVNEDGSVTLSGKNDGTNNSSFLLFYSIENPLILKKGTYIGSTGSDLSIKGLTKKTSEYMSFSSPYTIEEDTAFRIIYFGADKGSKREFNGETVYPMLMRGTVAEDYVEPVEAGTGVTLTRGEEEIPTAVGETLELSDVAKGSTLSVGDGAALYVEYNRDINEAFAELQQAIISLGGNI